MYKLSLSPASDGNITITVWDAGGAQVKTYRMPLEEAMDTVAFLMDLFTAFTEARNANSE